MFLSIMDFTDKGIQVVKFTPEYFVSQGWDVHYVVTRDNSRHGSYHYQDVINPPGVRVHRSAMPSHWLGERLRRHVFKNIYAKLRGYAAIVKLAWLAGRVLKEHHIDVMYGGGPHGALATKLVTLFHPGAKLRTVSRFYGVWDLYSSTLLDRRWVKLLLNLDIFLSLYLRSDLKIVTNDGTQGNKAVGAIRPSNLAALRFYVNGIDPYSLEPGRVDALRSSLTEPGDFCAVCLTRLVPLKRVDLCIEVSAAVIKKFGLPNYKLIVVGDGAERDRLTRLARELGIERNILFVGAVNNQDVKYYLEFPDVFLSTYAVSNVGNPLLEAIRAHKIIFTLNNGDTASWIRHRDNGFIYQDEAGLVDKMARDIVELARAPELRAKIKVNIQTTASEKLWTWNQRMDAEFVEINALLTD